MVTLADIKVVSDYLVTEVQQMSQDDTVYMDRMAELKSLRSALLGQKDFHCALTEQLKRATENQMKLDDETLNEIKRQLQQQFDKSSAIRKQIYSKNVLIGLVPLVTTNNTGALSNSPHKHARQQFFKGSAEKIHVISLEHLRLPAEEADRKRKTGSYESNASESETHTIEVQQCNQRNNSKDSDVKFADNHLMDVLLRPSTANPVNNSEQSEETPQLKKCECQIRISRISIEAPLKKAQDGRKQSKTYSCADCDKAFKRKCKQKLHLRIHTGEKPYKCGECGVSFAQKGNCVVHQRIHTGEKPFLCSICSTAFNQKTGLLQHLLIHSNEKPFLCHLCKRSFRQQNHLLNHMNIHNGKKPYKCNVCEKKFRQKSNLIVHRKAHTEEE